MTIQLAKIELTKQQAENVAWAIAVMPDFAAGTPEDAGYDLDTANAARIDGLTFTCPMDIAFLEDLQYRLTEQLKDMAEGNGLVTEQARQGTIRCAENAWDRIADATGFAS